SDPAVGRAAREDVTFGDGQAGVRGVPHHAVTGVDAHVVGRGTEEDQVARHGVGPGHAGRGLTLGLGHTGKLDTAPGEDILREAGAVEAGAGGAAVDVVDPGQAGCDGDHAARAGSGRFAG